MFRTYHLLGLDGLITTSHADKLAIRIGDDLVDLLVEHVGSTVDGAQTSKGLGQLAETVQRVDVRGLAVSGHRLSVQDDTVDGISGGLGDVAREHVSLVAEMAEMKRTRHRGEEPSRVR